MRPVPHGDFDASAEGRPTHKLPERGGQQEASLTPTVKRLDGPLSTSRPLAAQPVVPAPPWVPVPPVAPANPPVDALPQRVFRIIELPVPPEALTLSYDANTSHLLPTTAAPRPATPPMSVLIGGGLLILAGILVAIFLLVLR